MNLGDQNPYDAGQAEYVPPLESLEQCENLRQNHLDHEYSIKAIGLLFLLSGVIVLIVFLGGKPTRTPGLTTPTQMQEFITFVVPSILAAVLTVLTGIGLRLLQTWARWTAVLLCSLGLFLFPIVTLFAAYFLYLLLSKKGAMVFSTEYQYAIQLTSHMDRRIPKLVLVFFGILLFAFFAYVFSGL